jgi:plastocyanin domain-containing protein
MRVSWSGAACRAALVLLPVLLGVACARHPAGGREVAISVTEDGFVPATVHVKRGEPVTLVITRRTDATCATSAVFAGTGKSYPLPLNKPVRIPLQPTATGTIDYACPMDMYRGKVIVE